MSDLYIPEDWKCPHTPAKYRPLICLDCTADEVFALYSKINRAYRMGDPVCSDQQFDMYEELFRLRFPEDKRFWKVGQYE